MLVEIAVALLGKLSPQLPVMSLTVPLKTLTGFAILAGSLALWPRFIEARFAGLLDLAERLISPRRPPGWEDSGHARRAHRTGNPASPRQSAQGRRHPAQPRADRGGRNSGRRAGAWGVWAAASLESWRGAFAGFLALGAAGTAGKPAATGADAQRDAPAVAGHAWRRSGMVMAAVAAAGAGRGRGADRRSHRSSPDAVGFKLDRINPLTQRQEPVFAARRGAPGQVAAPGGSSGCLRRAAHRPAD